MINYLKAFAPCLNHLLFIRLFEVVQARVFLCCLYEESWLLTSTNSMGDWFDSVSCRICRHQFKACFQMCRLSLRNCYMRSFFCGHIGELITTLNHYWIKILLLSSRNILRSIVYYRNLSITIHRVDCIQNLNYLFIFH